MDKIGKLLSAIVFLLFTISIISIYLNMSNISNPKNDNLLVIMIVIVLGLGFLREIVRKSILDNFNNK